MNHVVAYEFLASQLASFRRMGFDELLLLVGERSSERIVAKDGIEYLVEVFIGWQSREGGDILISGTASRTAWGGRFDRLDESFAISRSV